MQIQAILNTKSRIHWYSAAILTVLFLVFGILLSPEYLSFNLIIKISFYFVITISTFLVFYLKKANRIRWILFSVMSVLMSVWFMSYFFGARGHIGFTAADIEEGVPFCHIAIVNNLLSVPILRIFVSPGKLTGSKTSIYPMILIWLWSSILIGKGWCSWGCFYGGWDSFFSSITKKQYIKIPDKISKKLRLLPFAFLIVIALFSLLSLTPVLCAYLCPFKTVTEFQQVTNFTSWFFFIITVSAFVSFCVLMPIFFGRRIWCTYLCPFGALQSIIGQALKIFKLKIDKDKCIDCKKCINICKTAGITESSLKNKKFTLNCSLCGACLENCPKEAIYMTAFGIKNGPVKLFKKLTIKLKNIKIINQIRLYLINIFNDVLNPLSIFYFFSLAVLFTFFSGFYFDSIKYITILISGN